MSAIHELSGDLTDPADFAQVFPNLIRAMKDESEMVREAAAFVVGNSIFRLSRLDWPATDERDPTIVCAAPRPRRRLRSCSRSLRQYAGMTYD